MTLGLLQVGFVSDFGSCF